MNKRHDAPRRDEKSNQFQYAFANQSSTFGITDYGILSSLAAGHLHQRSWGRPERAKQSLREGGLRLLMQR